MARFVSLQTNFSTGELDPLLRARVDLQAYTNALEECNNFVVQPQGGIHRRPGSKYLASLPNTGSDSVANGSRLVSFEFSTSDSYMLVFTHNRMTVVKNKQVITDINGSGNDYLDTSSLGLTGAVVEKMCWVQSADTLIVVEEDVAPIKIVRGAGDSTWTATAISFDSVPKYNYVPAASNPAGTITPSAVAGNVTITASSGVFSASHVGQYINASPQGRAKIVQRVSSTVVNVITEFPFFNTSAIASGSWELETGYEAVWSGTRGYPRTVTFHEGRLFFGGVKSRPSTVFGSKVGLFFDFDPEEGLDDDALEATLDTSTFNSIVDITSGRDLQIFTTGGEFYVPQQGLDPITPLNFFIRTATRNGAKENVRVQQLETGTLFLQRQGKSLSEFAFTDTSLSYITTKVSLLNGHLLKTPTNIALRKSVATDENDLLLITNSDDGTMAVYSLLRSQNVIAPSEWNTNGSYLDVGVDITTIYTVVKRTIDSTDYYFLEYFDDDMLVDSAVTGTTGSSATVAHLDTATVDIILDGAVQAQQAVASNTVTFTRASTTSFQVGLPFTTRAVTMPVELRLAVGTRLGFKKRIVEVNALVLNSQHMKINGTNIPFRALGSDILDEAVPEFTGTKTLHGILGYTDEGKITIEQDVPLKLTLLGMEYKVATHQGT